MVNNKTFDCILFLLSVSHSFLSQEKVMCSKKLQTSKTISILLSVANAQSVKKVIATRGYSHNDQDQGN